MKIHMTDLLEKLFESVPKVRILRVCMRNPDTSFTIEDLASRSQLKRGVVKRELAKLIKIRAIETGIVKISKEIKQKIGRGKKAKVKITMKSKKARVYFANKHFTLFTELQNLVTKSSVASKKEITNKIRTLGNVKLALVSGVFTNNENARTDLLIVGDRIKPGKINSFLSKIESDIGKSIHYTLMDTSEFKYRMDMYDRFLRDILEFPHEKLINKVNI